VGVKRILGSVPNLRRRDSITLYMSHYQSRGDRSEAQLKKAGRSSGPGHQRSGAPSTAVKGGGAGGPSPSGSAPPASGVSQSTSQTFPVSNTPGRPTTPGSGRPSTPGSSTNRGYVFLRSFRSDTDRHVMCSFFSLAHLS
jgi:hypothetical protein